MLSESVHSFGKRDIDRYLYEFTKEYKRLGGRHIPIEIILVGGAAVMENYGFRETTRDIDAILPTASIIKESIRHTGDKYALPDGWLNDDFVKTKSYSSKLFLYSVPYKTVNQVLNVRTVTAEYLIAMKLMSARDYKNDLSDIAGILNEHKSVGKEITYEMIDTAVNNLYGSWDLVPHRASDFLKDLLNSKDLQTSYNRIREEEKHTRRNLIEFEKQFPGRLTKENLKLVESKQFEIRTNDRASVLTRLKAYLNELHILQPVNSKHEEKRTDH